MRYFTVLIGIFLFSHLNYSDALAASKCKKDINKKIKVGVFLAPENKSIELVQRTKSGCILRKKLSNKRISKIKGLLLGDSVFEIKTQGCTANPRKLKIKKNKNQYIQLAFQLSCSTNPRNDEVTPTPTSGPTLTPTPSPTSAPSCQATEISPGIIEVNVLNCGAKPHETAPWFNNKDSFNDAIKIAMQEGKRLNARAIVYFPAINNSPTTYITSPLRIYDPVRKTSVSIIEMKDFLVGGPSGKDRNYGQSIEFRGPEVETNSEPLVKIAKLPYNNAELDVFDSLESVDAKIQAEDLIPIGIESIQANGSLVDLPLSPPEMTSGELLSAQTSNNAIGVWGARLFLPDGNGLAICERLPDIDLLHDPRAPFSEREKCFRVRYFYLSTLAQHGYSYHAQFSQTDSRANFCRQYINHPNSDERKKLILWDQARGCSLKGTYDSIASIFKSKKEGEIRASLSPLIEVVHYGDENPLREQHLLDGCLNVDSKKIETNRFDFQISDLILDGQREVPHPETSRAAPFKGYAREDEKVLTIRNTVSEKLNSTNYDGMVSANVERVRITGSASDALNVYNACTIVKHAKLLDSTRGGLTPTGKSYTEVSDTIIGDEYASDDPWFSTALNQEQASSGIGFLGNPGDPVFDEINIKAPSCTRVSYRPEPPSCERGSSTECDAQWKQYDCDIAWVTYGDRINTPLTPQAKAALKKATKVFMSFDRVKILNPNKLGLPIQIGMYAGGEAYFKNSEMDGGELFIASMLHPRDIGGDISIKVVFDNSVLRINDNNNGRIIYPGNIDFTNNSVIIIDDILPSVPSSFAYSPLRVMWIRGNYDFWTNYDSVTQQFSPIKYLNDFKQNGKIRFTNNSGIILGDSQHIKDALSQGRLIYGIDANVQLDPSAKNTILFDESSFITSIDPSYRLSTGINALGVGVSDGGIEFKGLSNAKRLITVGHSRDFYEVPIRFPLDPNMKISDIPTNILANRPKLLSSLIQPKVKIQNPNLTDPQSELISILNSDIGINFIFNPTSPNWADRMIVRFNPAKYSPNLVIGNRYLKTTDGFSSYPVCIKQGDTLDVTDGAGTILRKYICDVAASNMSGTGQVWRQIL